MGTVIGYVWAPYLQKWSAAGAALFPDEVTVGKALLNGQIDGYINGEGVIHAELVKLHANGEWQKNLAANDLGPDADPQLKSPAQLCAGD